MKAGGSCYSPGFATDEGERIIRSLTVCSSIALLGHKNPDGDCAGSVAGLGLFLQENGVGACCLIPGGVPDRYNPLMGDLDTETPSEPVECAVALDTSTADRLDEFRDLYQQAGRRIVIDHHPDNELKGDMRWVVPAASSVAEMLWAVLRGRTRTPAILSALYVGMMTDTGRFSFSNTSAGTLEAAAEMVRMGVRPGALFEAVYRSRSLELLAFEAQILRRVELYMDGTVSLCVLDYNAYRPFRDLPTEDMAGRMLEVKGVELGGLLLEREPGRTKISLRSRGALDAAVPARRLGGGGHARAAGAELAVPAAEAKDRLLEMVKEEPASRGGPK